MTVPPLANQTDLPREFAFIRRHFAALAGPAALDLRDDAAVFTPPPGLQLVLATDAMVENVHFLPDDPPQTVGRKLLRCNLSDLAAMGAKPEGWLLTFARPPHITEDWVAQFCAGLKADQDLYGLSLMGGDTTSTSGPLVLSLTIMGSVAPGQAVQRRGAQVGDGLWVTGTIGDGALGLKMLQGQLEDGSGHLAQRYRLPEPRLGLDLYGLATCAMDVSDGLVQDTGHLARENGLAAVIDAAKVPLSPAARQAGPDWLRTCLTGGDDYELLMAVPPAQEDRLASKGYLESPYGRVPVTRIGHFHAGTPGVQVRDENGQALHIETGGWSHL
ncbi:thiamine-phosphate kinase [Acetobacter sp. TBRC 12305]|uniref:Thiamine-monophosphate kinase n=1 Tax=Acetobacter garciniae TaxID=2817435 RepID=A0A939HNI1_9PROT|nr:thiamine-phosphate kinase [Acetobacter garciniae]MBO1324241.1 thiamine-phosphate kinase [Acetobacter garciniae]MBX0343930.1 thiamine-phosphate kinase [Acetobacter garciniae]